MALRPEVPADRCSSCPHGFHGLVCGAPVAVPGWHPSSTPCPCTGDAHQRGAE